MLIQSLTKKFILKLIFQLRYVFDLKLETQILFYVINVPKHK